MNLRFMTGTVKKGIKTGNCFREYDTTGAYTVTVPEEKLFLFLSLYLYLCL